MMGNMGKHKGRGRMGMKKFVVNKMRMDKRADKKAADKKADKKARMKRGRMKKKMVREGLHKMRGRMKAADKKADRMKKAAHRTGLPNTIKYIRTYGSDVQSGSSVTSTTITVGTGASGIAGTDFTGIVSFAAYIGVNVGAVTCSDSLARSWTQLGQVLFNSGWVITMFYINGVDSIPKNTVITVTHPGATRRVIFGDEFHGLMKTVSPPDQFASAHTSVAASFVASGLTAQTAQDKELVYGLIGVAGPATDVFKRPSNFTVLHDRGTAAGDGFDVRMINMFRLVDEIGTFEASGSLGVARQWAAMTQTFKSNTGGADISSTI